MTIEDELAEARAQAAAYRAERDLLLAKLRSVAGYADGLHFAGLLKDEKIVRAALAAAKAEDAHYALDMDLLRKLARGQGGKRTGALKRAGFLTWTVTEAGLEALARLGAEE